MRIKLNPTMLASLVLLVAPVAAGAQQGGAAPAQLPPQAQELITELQQVQSQMAAIQQQALADPELQAEQAAIGEQIQIAMAESDPTVPQKIERLRTLMQNAQEAQAAQDQAGMTAIVTEAQEIQSTLEAAQAEALEKPEIAPKLEDFQAHLQQKMTEIDPSAEELIQRFDELQAQLTDLMSQHP